MIQKPAALLANLRIGLISVAGIFLSSLSLSLNALTLSGIEVQSHKGEPLRAEISVSTATAEEWGQLVVTVAPAERFSQLGLVFTPSVGRLQVELLEISDGNKRIRLSSSATFSDHFVDLLIEAQTASGKWVKAFTLMLKPAPLKADTPLQLPMAASAQELPKAPPAEHLVQKGESASQIIQKWLTEDMSTQQMLVALLKNQPEAFIEGNVNLLRAGSVLKAPSGTAVRAIDAEDARQFLITQQKEFIAFSQVSAQNPQAVTAQAPSRQMKGKVGQDEPAPMSPSSTIDQLKLSQAKIDKQNAETRLAAQRALKDAQKQLDTLQSQVDQLVQLTATAPLSVSQSLPPTPNTSSGKGNGNGSGLLNLNRLLESPHQNSYFWAALTLLGVLAVGAGLRVQSRKTTQTLSTFVSTQDIGKSAGSASPNTKLEMPANIAALDLNLDLKPQAPSKLGGLKSPAITETLP